MASECICRLESWAQPDGSAGKTFAANDQSLTPEACVKGGELSPQGCPLSSTPTAAHAHHVHAHAHAHIHNSIYLKKIISVALIQH